jgi:hypothetical protein
VLLSSSFQGFIAEGARGNPIYLKKMIDFLNKNFKTLVFSALKNQFTTKIHIENPN